MANVLVRQERGAGWDEERLILGYSDEDDDFDDDDWEDDDEDDDLDEDDEDWEDDEWEDDDWDEEDDEDAPKRGFDDE